MAKTDTLTLNNDNYGTDWSETTTGSGVVTQADTEVTLEVPGNTAGQIARIQTVATNWDLDESDFYFQYKTVGIRNPTAFQLDVDYYVDANNYYRFRFSDASFTCRYNEAGGGDTQQGAGFTPADGEWYRIREASGTLFWDRASDSSGTPGTWNNLTSRTTGFTVTAGQIRFEASQQGGGNPTSTDIDGVIAAVNESAASGGGGTGALVGEGGLTGSGGLVGTVGILAREMVKIGRIWSVPQQIIPAPVG